MGSKRKQSIAEWELYDLSQDISETTNLAKSHPDRLAALTDLWKTMDDEMSPPLF